MRLWIRVRFQNEDDDWMERPISEKSEWEATVSPEYIRVLDVHPNQEE